MPLQSLKLINPDEIQARFQLIKWEFTNLKMKAINQIDYHCLQSTILDPNFL